MLSYSAYRKIFAFLCAGVLSLWIFCSSAQQVSSVAVSNVSHVGTPVITDDALGKNVVLFQSDYWRVVREFPGGYIGVLQKNTRGDGWNSMALALEWRRRIHPMQIGEGRSGELLLASYDLIDNLPSGRSQKVVTNGIDVWRIKRNASETDEPERVVSNLQLGGMDSLVYMDFNASLLKICGENQCYTWESGKEARRWRLEGLAEYEFVELAFSNEQAAALVRKKHDDRQAGPLAAEYTSYGLAILNEQGVKISSVEGGGIPWNIHWEKGKAIYYKATTREQYQNLFVFDIMRMPMSGAMGFGGNNFEGRIAWAQVYYLNGMMSVLEGSAKSLFAVPPSGLKERVFQETKLMADLCESDYPGYLSKRYSIDREPLKSVLHLGRISSVLMRAKATAGLALKKSCVMSLKSQLESFNGALEEPMLIDVGKEKLPYLRLHKGMPFWADGINVPYNYVSAYVEGMVALGSGDRTKSRLAGMLEVIRREELGNYPKTWRYCGNICDAGWSRKDAVSVNAPSWAGNGKALAHVSYRTMDARAILELARVKPAGADRRMAEHFRELTRTGWLLPSMNEVFARSGAIVALSEDVARRHARASAPWEIQSSVWALNQLALDAGR